MSILRPLVKPQCGKAVPSISLRSRPWCTQDRGSHSEYRPSSNENGRHSVFSHRNAVDDEEVQRVFFRALAVASSCSIHRHEQFKPQRRDRFGTQTSRSPYRQSGSRCYSTTSRKSKDEAVLRHGPFQWRAVQTRPEHQVKERKSASAVTADEYKALIDTYPSFARDRRRRRPDRNQHYPLASRLFLTAEQEFAIGDSTRQINEPQDEKTWELLAMLLEMIKGPIGQTPLDELWHTFEDLPQPRLTYLHDIDIYRMFRHLGWVEFKSESDAKYRYDSLLENCLEENVPLNERIWNTAVSFAAQSSKSTTSENVRAAVEVWRRMESFGVAADHVTFNILFDVAVKAEKFALAESIYEEIVARDMRQNRYLRTSLIYYAGAKGNGDGVRKAFRDLIDNGEIVDTTVMNCVLLSLIRSGEGEAAENTFSRMKLLHQQKFGTVSPRSWGAQRRLHRFLDRTAHLIREDRRTYDMSFLETPYPNEGRKDEVQQVTPLAPNARTYRIMITYHVETTANIDRVRELVKEMQACNLPLNGSIFYLLFRGFALHGASRTSGWTLEALEGLWTEFVETVGAGANTPNLRHANIADRADLTDLHIETFHGGATYDGEDDLASHSIAEDECAAHLSVGFSCAVLGAFANCAGHDRMTEVCDEIVARWKNITMQQQVAVRRFVRQNFRKRRRFA